MTITLIIGYILLFGFIRGVHLNNRRNRGIIQQHNKERK